MRILLPLLLVCASACSAQTPPPAAAASDVPSPPGPGPLQAEADAAKAAIEAMARSCAAGRVADVTARAEPSLKVSRPKAPDLGSIELPVEFRRLCAGAGAGSLAEVSTMVEDIAVQPDSALATVTLVGRIRGTPDKDFIVRGLVYLLNSPSGWRVIRAAYWPHEIPPVS